MFGISDEGWGGIIFMIVVFLFLREIFCWYWKQNEQVKLLREILDQIKGVRDPEHEPDTRKWYQKL